MNESTSPSIREALLLFTLRCNGNCVFCCEGGTEEDASLDEVKRVIDQLVDVMDFNLIDINGGEPLLRRKEVPEVMEYIRSKACATSLSTNTLALDIGLIEIMKQYLRRVNVSLEGATKDTHETLFPVQGSFRTITHNIQRLANTGFDVHVSVVVLNGSVHELRALATRCCDWGVGTLCLNKMCTARGKGRNFFPDDYPSEQELDGTLAGLKEEFGDKLHLYVNRSRQGQCILIRPDGMITGAPADDGLYAIGHSCDESIVDKWRAYPYRENHQLYCDEKFIPISSYKELLLWK